MKQLLSRHYGMRKAQVFQFDKDFVTTVYEELNGDSDKIEMMFCYSHYMGHTKSEFRHFCTYRLWAEPKLIKQFKKLEKKLVKVLQYFPFNRDAEALGHPQPLDNMTFKQLSDIYYISEEEMFEVFKMWYTAAMLKIFLIQTWDDGKEYYRRNVVHYALNTLGMEQVETLKYNEEDAYRRRNFIHEGI